MTRPGGSGQAVRTWIASGFSSDDVVCTAVPPATYRTGTTSLGGVRLASTLLPSTSMKAGKSKAGANAQPHEIQRASGAAGCDLRIPGPYLDAPRPSLAIEPR